MATAQITFVRDPFPVGGQDGGSNTALRVSFTVTPSHVPAYGIAIPFSLPNSDTSPFSVSVKRGQREVALVDGRLVLLKDSVTPTVVTVTLLPGPPPAGSNGATGGTAGGAQEGVAQESQLFMSFGLAQSNDLRFKGVM